MDKLYLRIGEIPPEEYSYIYRGDAILGREHGVSCYEVIYDENINKYRILLPYAFTLDTLGTLEGLGFKSLGYTESRAYYIITGDEIGYGYDNEPLLINIKIKKQLLYSDIFGSS